MLLLSPTLQTVAHPFLPYICCVWNTTSTSAWCCVLVDHCSQETHGIIMSLIKSATPSALRMGTGPWTLFCLDESPDIFSMVTSA